MLRTFLATALTRLAALGIANSSLRLTPVLVDGSCSSELFTSSNTTGSFCMTESSIIFCGVRSPCNLVRTGLVFKFNTGCPIANDRSLAVVLQEEQTETADDEDADCRY